MANILSEGKNCWRIVNAGRVSFLVDGHAYYNALAHAIENARRSIFILGWDINSRVDLIRGPNRENAPSAFGDCLQAQLARRPDLHIYVLTWDFPWIFAHERESRLHRRNGWFEHPRFHFHFDGNHPPGASHHQKIVLIDDSLAFAGGMDVSRARWDRPEHLVHDPCRYDPDGNESLPAHDVQLAVDGDIARVLADLVRERWRNAGAKPEASPVDSHDYDPWPAGLDPDLTNVRAAISRTLPAFRGQPPVREVESLHLDAIAAARRVIYIENQYLTSDTIVEAIGRRLQEPEGPEVLIILPLKNFGWLEEHTIEVLRFRSIRRIRETDAYGRVRICYPVVPGIGERWINVHSKVLIVDDRLVRVGSSNLTARSMVLDTECDVTIESGDDPAVSRGISRVRDRLLAEHLGLTPDFVSGFLREQSLVQLVDSRAGTERCLRKIEVFAEREKLLIDPSIVDPHRPLTTDMLIEQFAPAEVRPRAKKGIAVVLGILVALTGLAATWHWTPMRQWAEPAALAQLGPWIRDLPMTPLVVVLLYTAATLAMLPVTVLVLGTALIFGTWYGIIYSLAGCSTSALFSYWVGRVASRSTVEHFAGRRLRRVVERLSKRGILTMVTIRLLPIAPFTIVNMVIGASGIRLRHYALGTVIGMAPGIILISIFGSRVEKVLRNPTGDNLAVLGILTAGLATLLVWLHQRLKLTRC